MDIILPKGLRVELVDNENLIVPVGTKATLMFDERISLRSTSNTIIVMIDGDSMNSGLPMNQCEIITDNFKKTFKAKAL